MFDAAKETQDFALEVMEAITSDEPIEAWEADGYHDGDTIFRFTRADGCVMQVQIGFIRLPVSERR